MWATSFWRTVLCVHLLRSLWSWPVIDYKTCKITQVSCFCSSDAWRNAERRSLWRFVLIASSSKCCGSPVWFPWRLKKEKTRTKIATLCKTEVVFNVKRDAPVIWSSAAETPWLLHPRFFYLFVYFCKIAKEMDCVSRSAPAAVSFE